MKEDEMRFALFSQILSRAPQVPGKSNEAIAQDALALADAGVRVFTAAKDTKDASKDGPKG